jgi:hypothetical protein
LHDSPRVTCLFAGSVEHLMRDMFSNERRALYQFGGFHELSPISEVEVAVRLAHQRSPYERLEKKAANRALNALPMHRSSSGQEGAARGCWPTRCSRPTFDARSTPD